MPVTDDILILDGGMSRELVAFGAELRQPEWSALALMEQPDVVERVHRAFIAAGAGIVMTNSYALVPFHIGEARFHEEGSALAPHVGLWLGETLSLIAEAEAVCTAVAPTGKPVWISFTLDDTIGGSPRLRSGESVEAAARWIAASPAQAMLFNCSRPEVMAGAVRAAHLVLQSLRPGVRLGVYANAFAPVPRDGAANETLSTVRDDLGPERYLAAAAEWVGDGATILGGCCGIGCGHIEALHRRFAATAA